MTTPAWYWGIPAVIKHLITEQVFHKKLNFHSVETLSSLLERQAKIFPQRPMLYFENKCYRFGEINKLCNQFANGLIKLGATRGQGLGLFLENSPDFIIAYLATQRLGMYAVPLNTSLKGDGLEYLLEHSEIDFLLWDNKLFNCFKGVKFPKKLQKYFFSEIIDTTDSSSSPDWGFDINDTSTIMYTSGTTGRPKGVRFLYKNGWVRRIGMFSHLILKPDDILFTCLPLFHANALFLSVCASLWLGIPLVLSKKFSASSFWEEVNRHHATVATAIGAMIPILLKSPPSHLDKQNSLRLVLSAACPAKSWTEFEQRFDLKIWEGYSAVDGAQKFIFNLGNAPVGSIGRPLGIKYKIVDEQGNDVGIDRPGELIFWLGKDLHKKSEVPSYFKDQKATNEKVNDGYLKTGDLVSRDKKGFLYFIGRKTESMRRRGENVSAFEIENVLLKHPDILECAAYGVPSDLAEEDIMCALVLVEGKKIDKHQLYNWMKEALPRHAIPRYLRILSELPKTSTHRVIKSELKSQGITPDTIDFERI